MMEVCMNIVVTDHDYMDFSREEHLFNSYGAAFTVTQCTNDEEIITAAKEADIIINSDLPISKQDIEQLPKLKLIINYGIDVEHKDVKKRYEISFYKIDVEASNEKGVYVDNVQDYSQEDVADHTLALILSSVQKIIQSNNRVKAGRWSFSDVAPLHRLRTQTIGLISYGGIARILSKKLQAIGFTVLAYDPFVQEADVDIVSLEEVMASSDVVSIHAPLLESTYHLIDQTMLSFMKPNAILINAGRGSIIDENSLIKALQNGQIKGAALDVLEEEPIRENHPFLAMEQVILTPHVAFYSEEAMQELQKKTTDNVIDMLKHKTPRYAVNAGGVK